MKPARVGLLTYRCGTCAAAVYRMLYLEEIKDMDEIIRKHLIIYGDVQGVGFRYRAEHGAAALGVTGWVRNCWDDTVEMEVQGTPEQIRQLLFLINQGRFIDIQRIEEKIITVNPNERGFRVVH